MSSTPDVLNCYEVRSFWVSWVDGYVRVGTGYIYRLNTILQLEQKKPHPINAISISTMNGTEAEWEMEADNGK